MMIWQLPAATNPPRMPTLCINIDCGAPAPMCSHGNACAGLHLMYELCNNSGPFVLGALPCYKIGQHKMESVRGAESGQIGELEEKSWGRE